MCAASQRGSRYWRKTLDRYGEAGPKRILCVEADTKCQIISRTLMVTNEEAGKPFTDQVMPTLQLADPRRCRRILGSGQSARIRLVVAGLARGL
jgi:hypothetical protein